MAAVRRTVVVKIDVDDSDATLLHETVEEYLWACNDATMGSGRKDEFISALTAKRRYGTGSTQR